MQLFNTDHTVTDLVPRALAQGWSKQLRSREHRITGRKKYLHSGIHECTRVGHEHRFYSHLYFVLYRQFLYDSDDFNVLMESAVKAHQARDCGGSELAVTEFDAVVASIGKRDVVRRFKYWFKQTGSLIETVDHVMKSKDHLLSDPGDMDFNDYMEVYSRAMLSWATYMLTGREIAPYTFSIKEVAYYLLCHKYQKSRALKFCVDSYNMCHSVDGQRVTIVDYVQYFDHCGIISRRNLIYYLTKSGYADKIRHKILRRARYIARYNDYLENHNALIRKYNLFQYADKSYIPVLQALDAHLTQYEKLFHAKAHGGNVFNALLHFHKQYKPCGRFVRALDGTPIEALIENNSYEIKDWQNEKEWLLQRVKKQRIPKTNKHHHRMTVPLGVLISTGQINHFTNWLLLRRTFSSGTMTFKTMMLYFSRTCGMTLSAARSCVASFVKSPYVEKDGRNYRLKSQHSLCKANFIQTVAIEYIPQDYKKDKAYLRRAILSSVLSFPHKERVPNRVIANKLGVSSNTFHRYNDCPIMSQIGTKDWRDIRRGAYYGRPEYVKAYFYTKNLKHGSSRDNAQGGNIPRVRTNPRRTVITVQEKPGFKVLLYTSVNRTKCIRDKDMNIERRCYAHLPLQRTNL